jgi:hypothetical protein
LGKKGARLNQSTALLTSRAYKREQTVWPLKSGSSAVSEYLDSQSWLYVFLSIIQWFSALFKKSLKISIFVPFRTKFRLFHWHVVCCAKN